MLVRRSPKRAFSLVELMVVVFVVAVLVGLLVPALGAAMRSSRETVSLANLRSIHAVFEAYMDENGDFYPVVDPSEVYPYGCEGATIGVPFWHIHYAWPAVVRDNAEWSEHEDVFLSPMARRDRAVDCGWPSSYSYSTSFVARPEVWRDSGTPDPSLLVGARRTEVRFPSAKALMWDSEMPYVSGELPRSGPDIARPVPMLFADGNAQLRSPAEATEPVTNPFADSPVRTRRLHNTRDGVYGRDY